MKLTLTKSSVESLPPAPEGKSQELYYDLRLPGRTRSLKLISIPPVFQRCRRVCLHSNNA